MTLQKWIKDRAIHGFPTFSIEDVRETGMYSSEQILQNDVVEENELADKLYEQIRNLPGSLMYMPLSTSAEDNTSERNSRWKININVQIEKDDL